MDESAESRDDVQALLERALGLPPGAGCVAVAGPPSPPEAAGAPRHERSADTVPLVAVTPPRDRRTGRRGPAAGLVLVGVLAALWVAVQYLDRSPSGTGGAERAVAGDARVGAVASTAGSVGAPADPAEALFAAVPAAWRTACRSAPGLDDSAVAAISCTPADDGVGRVDVRAFADAALMNDRYSALASRDVTSPRVGAPRCAAGRQEERGWSRPEEPERAAGRYACRIDDGVASLWWTSDAAGVLVHAERTDDDLAALFDWWCSDDSPLPG